MGKPSPRPSPHDVLQEPWTSAVGTENHIKHMHRAHLAPGYPADLARDSTPEMGSLSNGTMQIRHRTPPYRLKGKR